MAYIVGFALALWCRVGGKGGCEKRKFLRLLVDGGNGLTIIKTTCCGEKD